ncbi:DUF4142 domain-containing protein [Chryseobacterium sp.]|uniref:DUF4142 domain-containing protein n=1 Tax=Chryseobacterium sp. TaxID=1871047 RepID=UPI0025C2DCD0|nr:DUF4142 domain-containing protein [Chryseobacterium sp.]MBV8326621.1 DUF4142 domain-containing protein [Chryseobacterium sp.]
MKNYVLSLFAAAVLIGCKKNETPNVNSSDGNPPMSAPVDSGMAVKDSAAVTGAQGTKTTLSDQDKKFADAAAKGGLMEVMMGKLAETNAANPTVKSLGAMMVSDHSKANEELKKWASAIGYTLPAALDADQQKIYDGLKAKKGADFDRAYTDLMVSDHKEDIEEFKKQAANGTEASLKSFAAKTLPTLEHHLKESEKAKSGVK